jgi:molecular chaperone GrpE
MNHEHDIEQEKDSQENNTERVTEEEATDDIVPEDEEAGLFGSRATIKKLREKLKEAESAKQEYLTGWQKTKAEYINTRKRDEEASRALSKFAAAGLIEELLPALDSFDLALAHAKQAGGNGGSASDEWAKGMMNIYNQILSVFTAHGLKQINPIGEEFDPTVHEAIGMIDTDKPEEDNIVLDVLQKGYTLHDKVLRTARVRVGRAKS